MSLDVALQPVGAPEPLEADGALVGRFVGVNAYMAAQVSFHGEGSVTVWATVRFVVLVRLHVRVVLRLSGERTAALTARVGSLFHVRLHVDLV